MRVIPLAVAPRSTKHAAHKSPRPSARGLRHTSTQDARDERKLGLAPASEELVTCSYA